MTPPSVLDIYQARARIASWLAPTPLRLSAWLSSAAAGPAHLKLESVQPSCSFKIRGAFNALLRLVEEHPDPTTRPLVVAASAGNHGRAMALAAEALGSRAVIFTPSTAPRSKRDAIRALGVELRDDASSYDEAERKARRYADACDGVYISPYNHPDVIAGAGTIALELAEACPDVGTVFVPLGGGGLASGIGLVLRAIAPAAKVVGVEAAASTPFTTGLAHGVITAIEPRPTLADGLAGNLEPGAITFGLVREVVDEVVVVTEEELRATMRVMAAEEHVIVEGSAAVPVAALMARRGLAAYPAVVIVSGANVDAEVVGEVLLARRSLGEGGRA
jgi:threonine dehydratase